MKTIRNLYNKLIKEFCDDGISINESKLSKKANLPLGQLKKFITWHYIYNVMLVEDKITTI